MTTMEGRHKMTMTRAGNDNHDPNWEEEPSSSPSDYYEIRWMWADAKLLPGLAFLAKKDPLRWSKWLHSIRDESLSNKNKDRPVRLQVRMRTRLNHPEPRRPFQQQPFQYEFPSMEQAVKWWSELAKMSQDEECCSSGRPPLPDDQEDYKSPQHNPLLGMMMSHMSVPAFALFLRTHVQREHSPFYHDRHILAAYSYATRAVNYPKQVAARQHQNNKEWDTKFREYHMSWKDFRESSKQPFDLAKLCNVAHWGEAQKPRYLSLDEKQWRLSGKHSTDMWTVYTTKTAAMIAIRGGDTSTNPDDLKNHPGSPARAFLMNFNIASVPDDLLTLFDTIEDLSRDLAVTITAYSQGAIPAMACARRFATAPPGSCRLKRIYLLNPATVFWPPWLAQVKPAPRDDEFGDIVEDDDCLSPSISSFVVEGDPLSHGVGSSFRVPRVPGTTYLLPTCGRGFANHSLKHFLLDDDDDKQP